MTKKELIGKVAAAAGSNFHPDSFKFFWDKDILCLYFKEEVDYTKAMFFESMVYHLIHERTRMELLNDKDWSLINNGTRRKDRCTHDWLRILTGLDEGKYECTICGKVSTKEELDGRGESYTD